METQAAAQPLPDHSRAPGLHAGFWMRIVAYLVDGLVMSPAFVVLFLIAFTPAMLAADKQHPDPGLAIGSFALLMVLSIVIPWLYYALCESSRWQATPGKLALGLRVTDEGGQRIGFGRASGRFFGKIISGAIMDIGYMLAGWTARKQALHDLMASCCVVRKDGLQAFERGGYDEGSVLPNRGGMPGWGIALIVVGAGFFVVVPIFAILAAIAIPAYQNYIVRSQVAEGMALASGFKTAVAEYAVNHDAALPPDNAAAGLPPADSVNGRYVTRVGIEGGSIVVTYGGGADREIAGDHLIFKPYGNSDDVRWHCGSEDIKAALLPIKCRQQGSTAAD